MLLFLLMAKKRLYEWRKRSSNSWLSMKTRASFLRQKNSKPSHIMIFFNAKGPRFDCLTNNMAFTLNLAIDLILGFPIVPIP